MSVAAAPATESAEPILRLRGVGRRFGGLHAVRDVDLDVRPGERRAILGPNGAGKTTLFNVIAGEFPPTAGTIELFGRDVTYLPARRRVGLGLTRTYQTSRLFLGLSVEDNLYLALVGVEGGHLRPVLMRSAETAGCGREARAIGRARRARGRHRRRSCRTSRTASSASSRSGMALAGEPKLMMLDEPAAGLSRAERREAHASCCSALDRSITLLLIEHDMDVALTVAEYVTMMHDGRVIVEGTPAEIRANELVHDLYLGRVTMTTSEPVLAVKGLDAYYGQSHVLQGVEFEMGAEPVAIIGRNGMGKTTLCKVIMGLVPPRATGSVVLRRDGARRASRRT